MVVWVLALHKTISFSFHPFCKRIVGFGKSQVSRHLSTTNADSKVNDHSNLPAETLYIIDGTAMLFHAYFSRSSKEKFQDAVFKEEFSTKLYNKLSVELQKEVKEIWEQDELKSEATTSTTVDISTTSSSQLLSCSALSSMVYLFAHFIRTVKPTYIAIAFDYGRDTFRSQLYPNYKKQRPKVKFVFFHAKL